MSLEPERFVVFAQNHDHIGNRPDSGRLVSLVSQRQAHLVAALVILAPGIPLLFMGEEYGERAPFPYFIDHGDPELIEAVRAGRAAEFASLAEKGQLFDPAAESTFAAARIDRTLRDKDEHRVLYELYRKLIALRRANPALRRSERGAAHAKATDGVLTLLRAHLEDTVVGVFNLTDKTGRRGPPPGARSQRSRALEQPARAGDGGPGPGAKQSDLAPWGFAVYHLSQDNDGVKGNPR